MHARALAPTKAGAEVPAKALPLPWHADNWCSVRGPQHPCLAPAQLVPALPLACRPNMLCGTHIAPVGCIPQQHYAPAFRAYAGEPVPTIHLELCDQCSIIISFSNNIII